MTLKQTITDELLNSIADPGELEEVVRKYSKSKGPFYSALAEATSQLLRRLGKARQQTVASEAHTKPPWTRRLKAERDKASCLKSKSRTGSKGSSKQKPGSDRSEACWTRPTH